MFVEFKVPKKLPVSLANSKRSVKDKATLKVKRSSVSIGLHGDLLKKHNLDFTKGLKIWFNPETCEIKIGVSVGSDLVAKCSESGYQSISVRAVLKSFGFNADKSAFNLPIKLGDKSVTIRLSEFISQEVKSA